MKLYVWVKPAFFKHNLVDHVWVTTYDLRAKTYSTLQDVANAGEGYWLCHGDFHPLGSSTKYAKGLISIRTTTVSSLCLVTPNQKGNNGTIFRYAIDGVCHQVANQVLYPTHSIVEKARGYRLSTVIYNTYGRSQDAWLAKIHQCQPLRLNGTSPQGRKSYTFLIRAIRVLNRYSTILQVDTLRLLDSNLQQLHNEIDRIDGLNEFQANEKKANDINLAIQNFMRMCFSDLSESLGADSANLAYQELFGYSPNEEVSLIDPLLMNPNSE